MKDRATIIAIAVSIVMMVGIMWLMTHSANGAEDVGVVEKPDTGGMTGNFITPEFDRSGQPFTMTVHFYDNYDDMALAYREFRGKPFSDNREAWAAWSVSDYWCDIHVVRRNPSRLSRALADDLAHELSHCLYGEWHK